jgi:hypothetical protein
MPDARDALEVLRFELDFLERGGYARQAWPPAKPVNFFHDSLTCLDFAAGEPGHSCRNCVLYDFVPDESRNEILPCHSIPLNDNGDCIASLDQGYNQHAVEKAVVSWLRATIRRMERESAAEEQTA